MNWNWYQLRRLRGALILILIGGLFLLNQADWFHWDVWPLFLIGLGAILLAERLLPLPPPPPGAPYPPYSGCGPQYPYGYQQPPSATTQEPPPPTGNPGEWHT